jgi:hypothetical protein
MLADRFTLERGAILSAFPLRTHPAPENFPVRNRIVAGMQNCPRRFAPHWCRPKSRKPSKGTFPWQMG